MYVFTSRPRIKSYTHTACVMIRSNNNTSGNIVGTTGDGSIHSQVTFVIDFRRSTSFFEPTRVRIRPLYLIHAGPFRVRRNMTVSIFRTNTIPALTRNILSDNRDRFDDDDDAGGVERCILVGRCRTRSVRIQRCFFC